MKFSTPVRLSRKDAGNHAPTRAKVQKRVFCQMHQSVDLFLRAFEVVDSKGIYGDEFDIEARTYFQNLVVMNSAFFFFFQRGTCAAYPPQRNETVDVALYYLHAFDTGIPSIAIHDEGNMLWYRACSQHGEEGTPDAIEGLVAQPAHGGQERHGHGNARVAGWTSLRS